MFNFRRNADQNEAIQSIDVLVNEQNNLEAEMKKIQREKDLKVDSICQIYDNKLDKIIRKLDANKMKQEQAKKYAQKQLKGDK